MYRYAPFVVLAACSMAHAVGTFYMTVEGINSVLRVAVPETGNPFLLPQVTHGSFDRVFSIATRARGDLLVNSRGPCTACLGGGLTDMFAASCDTLNGSGQAVASATRNPHGVCVVGDVAYLVDSYNGRIVRYQLSDNAAPLETGSYAMPLAPWGGRGIVAAPQLGELLVADCCNINGIHRFTLKADGSVMFKGTITGNSMSGPHNMIWAPWGELLVGSFNPGGVVSRFRFDAAGNAIPNGVIAGNGINVPGSLAFSESGELFIFNNAAPTVSRFQFDAAYQAIAIGTLAMPYPAIAAANVGQMPAMIAVIGEGSSPCLGGTLSMSLVGASAQFQYQWYHDGVPISLEENATAQMDTLTIAGVQAADAGSYSCNVMTSCGSVTSNSLGVAFCQGDFNCDGGVDGLDVDAFFTQWENGSQTADLNADGGVDGGDVSAFFERWEAGC
ncbi:MAG: hypothetical protein NTV94_01370 [Planctomycetota bacterium]|nr:hypothetical protein [Planctomycetota bacterium]